MKLFNTLTRGLEEFGPIKDKQVGIYSCGPTVYWNQHIGHMYAYTQWDCLVRALRYLGFKVTWVMNITDVGHMTSDEDVGEDKMEKGAKREGLSVWQIADRYIAQFKESLSLLNITSPDVMCRATEHIQEQIDLIKKIEANGFTYRTKTGIVFDTAKFPGYADFAKLNLKEQYSGSRVEVDPEKKKPWDFLLWVTNQPNHIMQWDSPWGRGFPGWHIECTAMSVKYLGEQFDIHTGGKEHVPVHHTNEVAQAYGAFGRQTANFWLHNEWLTFKGEKISKSAGNFILVSDLEEKGFGPLALRYLIMTSHYRAGLEFSWESLGAAQTALNRLYENVAMLRQKVAATGGVKLFNLQGVNVKMEGKETEWREKFIKAISDDLNMPQAIAVAWEMLKGDLDNQSKYTLLLDWDRVLGLKLEEVSKVSKVSRVPKAIKELVEKREELRKEGKWPEADEARKKIEDLGWLVEDTESGPRVKPLFKI